MLSSLKHPMLTCGRWWLKTGLCRLCDLYRGVRSQHYTVVLLMCFCIDPESLILLNLARSVYIYIQLCITDMDISSNYTFHTHTGVWTLTAVTVKIWWICLLNVSSENAPCSSSRSPVLWTGSPRKTCGELSQLHVEGRRLNSPNQLGGSRTGRKLKLFFRSIHRVSISIWLINTDKFSWEREGFQEGSTRINHSMSSNITWPCDWAQANITPILKGESKKPLDTRPKIKETI